MTASSNTRLRPAHTPPDQFLRLLSVRNPSSRVVDIAPEKYNNTILRAIAIITIELNTLECPPTVKKVSKLAARSIMQTFIDNYIEQGRRQGMQQGVQRGEALTLLRQMQRKFGLVPESVRQRVESADCGTLLTWLDRILDANRIELSQEF